MCDEREATYALQKSLDDAQKEIEDLRSKLAYEKEKSYHASKMLETKIMELGKAYIQCNILKAENQEYKSAARLYGVDARTMLELAKSKIKSSADNVRMMEKTQEILRIFDYVPKGLSDEDMVNAIIQYDGDGSKPYCDLVYCGLKIIRDYLEKRSEYDEWRKGNLPESF